VKRTRHAFTFARKDRLFDRLSVDERRRELPRLQPRDERHPRDTGGGPRHRVKAVRDQPIHPRVQSRGEGRTHAPGLNRFRALSGLRCWSQMYMPDILTRSEPPVSLVRSDREQSWAVAADAMTSAAEFAR
jgi:hypothetical protein